MSPYFSQYKSVLLILIRNGLQGGGSKRLGKRSHRGGIAAIVISAIATMVYGAVMSINMTISAYDNGVLPEILYFYLFLGQVVVLLFGGYTAMNYLYFSKDNVFLSTLPIKPSVIFAAKFTLTYLVELAYSFLVLFPMLTTAGIVGNVYHLGFTPLFFSGELVVLITSPIVPLVIVTALSLPLMRVMAYLRKKSTSMGIILTIVFMGIFVGYYAVIISLSSFGMDEATGKMIIPKDALLAFSRIKAISIYNYPLVESLMCHRVWLFLPAYILGCAVLLGLTILLSKYLYGKGVAYISELGGASLSERKKTEGKYTAVSPLKALYIKEFRTLVKSPMLLVSTILTTLMPVIMMVFFNFMSKLSNSSSDDSFYGGFTTGMITMMSFVMIGGVNQLSLIGFSREGKGIMLTRSLPIDPKVVIDSKLLFSTTATLIGSLICGILFPFISGTKSWIAAIGLFSFVLIGGFGMNCINLLNDLKRPNFNWNNINELTKNNTRSLRPFFITLALGMLAIVLQVVLSLFDFLAETLSVVIYYGVLTLVAVIMAVIGYKKLRNNYALLMKNLEV